MHRTQILLEDWQYQALKAAAERQERSISSLVREAVAGMLRKKQRPAANRLAEIAGIGEDRDSSGRDHDRVLYGPRGERS